MIWTYFNPSCIHNIPCGLILNKARYILKKVNNSPFATMNNLCHWWINMTVTSCLCTNEPLPIHNLAVKCSSFIQSRTTDHAQIRKQGNKIHPAFITSLEQFLIQVIQLFNGISSLEHYLHKHSNSHLHWSKFQNHNWSMLSLAFQNQFSNKCTNWYK